MEIKPGDFVYLTDEFSIEEVMDQGGDINKGLELCVSEVTTVESEEDGGPEWTVVKTDGHTLVVLEMDGVTDVMVAFTPDGWENGDRLDMVKCGLDNIFEEDYSSLSDAEFSKVLNDSDDNEYHLDSTDFGETNEGGFGSVAVWLAPDEKSETSNDSIVILETAAEPDQENGGLLEMFYCDYISENDMEVMSA